MFNLKFETFNPGMSTKAPELARLVLAKSAPAFCPPLVMDINPSASRAPNTQSTPVMAKVRVTFFAAGRLNLVRSIFSVLLVEKVRSTSTGVVALAVAAMVPAPPGAGASICWFTCVDELAGIKLALGSTPSPESSNRGSNVSNDIFEWPFFFIAAFALLDLVRIFIGLSLCLDSRESQLVPSIAQFLEPLLHIRGRGVEALANRSAISPGRVKALPHLVRHVGKEEQ